MKYRGWINFENGMEKLAKALEPHKKGRAIFGQARGGLCAAVYLSHALEIPMVTKASPEQNNLIWVDDIVDSGKTLKEAELYLSKHTIFSTWLIRENIVADTDVIFAESIGDEWVVFPWENKLLAANDKADYETKR